MQKTLININSGSLAAAIIVAAVCLFGATALNSASAESGQPYITSFLEPENSWVQFGIPFPTRMATGPDNRIYISDAKSGQIHICDSRLNHIKTITGLDSPLGIAVDSRGRIFVGNDGRDNIEVYSPDGRLLSVIDSGNIGMPNDLALDRQGNLYVADSTGRVVKVYDVSGRWIRDIGAAEGGLVFPVSVAVSDKNTQELYVADQGDSYIKVFSLKGALLRRFGGPVPAFSSDWQGRFVRLQSVDIDKRNRVHAADSCMNRVQVLNRRSGNFIGSYGQFGSEPGRFNLPLDILISSGSKVLVANAGNHRVEVYPPGSGRGQPSTGPDYAEIASVHAPAPNHPDKAGGIDGQARGHAGTKGSSGSSAIGAKALQGSRPAHAFFSPDSEIAKSATRDFEIIDRDATGMTIEIDLPEYEVSDIEIQGVEFQIISIAGCVPTEDIGSPQLPVKVIDIELDEGTVVDRVSIVDFDALAEDGLRLLRLGEAVDMEPEELMHPFTDPLAVIQADAWELSGEEPTVALIDLPAVGESPDSQEAYPGILVRAKTLEGPLLRLILFPVQWWDPDAYEIIEYYKRIELEVRYE